MTPEPISQAERERWNLALPTALIDEYEARMIGRLLAALEAGETLARELKIAIGLIEDEYCSHLDDHGADNQRCFVRDEYQALAAWRAFVQGD